MFVLIVSVFGHCLSLYFKMLVQNHFWVKRVICECRSKILSQIVHKSCSVYI